MARPESDTRPLRPRRAGRGRLDPPADAPLAERMRPRTSRSTSARRTSSARAGSSGGWSRGRPAAVADPLGAAGHRQDDARPPARPAGRAPGSSRSRPSSRASRSSARRSPRPARRGGGARRTVLFIDEIHRFNKAQQDALLPAVEDGTVTLIGATTENPSFEVNAALLSRARVLTLQPLTEADVATILRRALADPERGLAALRPGARRRGPRPAGPAPRAATPAWP